MRHGAPGAELPHRPEQGAVTRRARIQRNRVMDKAPLFVGIDVIGGKWLTEINVTSPTGIVAIDRFNGTDTPGIIWDAIEARMR